MPDGSKKSMCKHRRRQDLRARQSPQTPLMAFLTPKTCLSNFNQMDLSALGKRGEKFFWPSKNYFVAWMGKCNFYERIYRITIKQIDCFDLRERLEKIKNKMQQGEIIFKKLKISAQLLKIFNSHWIHRFYSFLKLIFLLLFKGGKRPYPEATLSWQIFYGDNTVKFQESISYIKEFKIVFWGRGTFYKSAAGRDEREFFWKWKMCSCVMHIEMNNRRRNSGIQFLKNSRKAFASLDRAGQWEYSQPIIKPTQTQPARRAEPPLVKERTLQLSCCVVRPQRTV